VIDRYLNNFSYTIPISGYVRKTCVGNVPRRAHIVDRVKVTGTLLKVMTRASCVTFTYVNLSSRDGGPLTPAAS